MDRVRKGIGLAIMYTCIWSVFAAILSFTIGKHLVYLVTGSRNETVILNATNYLKFDTLFYFVTAVISMLRNSMQGLGEDCEVLVLFDSIPRGSLYHKRQRPRNAGIPAYRIAIRKGAGHLQTRTHCGADHGRCKAGFRQRHRYKQAMKKDTGHEFSCPASFGLSAMKDFGKCTTWRANESSRNVFSSLPHGKGKQPPNSRRKSRECGGWLFKNPRCSF